MLSYWLGTEVLLTVSPLELPFLYRDCFECCLLLLHTAEVDEKGRRRPALPTSAVDFGLIPECDAYEAY